ncbi:hypothetical protein, partial [Bradyrhizobium sp. SZCCHNS3018]|uniref:hypothetical protein n=1 Tax=Bradyrhizobium sp. SZCCHNS3018 TaxID=3057319 RepID=UPI002915D281
ATALFGSARPGGFAPPSYTTSGDTTTWSAGCDGRDVSQRVSCLRTNGTARTAKSHGPGAATLASSS